MASPILTFGPEGEQWHYTPSTKTYDLTRNSSSALNIATTGGREGTSITISPAISALIIIDMQNFFLNPRCRDHPLGLAAVQPTIQAIEKCRKAGIQIIWHNWALTESDLESMPASIQHGFSGDLITGHGTRRGLGSELSDSQGRCLVAGSWNAEIYAPLQEVVQPQDVHCTKNRMSGLWNEEQPLWRYLRKEGIRTLLFAGVNTDQCVLGTLTSAYNAGWDCVLVEDCCATRTVGGKEVCVHNIGNSYGFIIDSKTLADGDVVKNPGK